MKKQLSIGRMRGLQQISNDDNVFTIVALDHRGSLKQAMKPDAPDAITYQQVVDFKLDVIRALASHASAFFVPASSNRRQFFRPAVTCETQRHPRAPPWNRSMMQP